MRVIDYDNAMLFRWKQFYPNTYFVNSEQNVIFEVRNQISALNPDFNHNTESIFPFLALRRVGLPEILEDTNLSAGIHGLNFKKQETRVPFAKFLLRYQLDLYAASRQNFDEMNIEIQENFMRSQFMIIQTKDPAWENITYTMDKESFDDNTDIDSFDDNLNIYRSSLVYTIDAIFARKYEHLNVQAFDITLKHNVKVEPYYVRELPEVTRPYSGK